MISGLDCDHTSTPANPKKKKQMMDNDRVVLLDYASGVSPFGMRVRIALAVKGVEYVTEGQDLKVKSPLLLEMNPVHKKIPVLIHNGKPICESLIVVEYIDEVWHHKSPFLPTGPYERAKARFWADYVDQKVHDLGKIIWSTKGEELARGREEFMNCLKVLEGELGDKAYYGGEALGLVDIVLLAHYPWFHTFEIFGGFSMEAECPKLISWGQRCLEHNDSVSKTLADPELVYEMVLKYKKYFGID